MATLIDGYNLLHAMGVLSNRLGPTGLEKARLRLLGLLHSIYGTDAATVTVVFDAAGAPPGAKELRDYKGIRVRFAVHEAEADDLIESLIQQDSAPRQLTVVSNDHRIQRAAARRRCAVLGCLEYLESLEQKRRQRKARPEAENSKPAVVSETETRHWLRAFADLDRDPDLKELFNPWDYDVKDA